MWIFFIVLLTGLAVLVCSADWFVTGTAAIARNFGVAPLLIGLTIVGLGTSAPEILVSGIASWQGNAGLAVGNALGSNIANIGLILGGTALISPLAFQSQILKRELPVLMVTSLLCFVMAWDGLTRLDGILMLAGLVLFILWLVRTAIKKRNHDPFGDEIEHELPEAVSTKKAWVFTVLGLLGLLISSKMLVWAAVNIAQEFGVSDLVIGLTVVAVGTSLPELAASVASVLKKEDDLAVGNVIGSNMYNLLAVYSLPGLIAPGMLAENVVDRDFPVMLAFTLALFVLGYGISKVGRINRVEGMVLVSSYGAYQWLVFQNSVTG
ncbi:MAG: calcium/sodium antiporter [Gammaproteobacteria bacterium]